MDELSNDILLEIVSGMKLEDLSKEILIKMMKEKNQIIKDQKEMIKFKCDEIKKLKHENENLKMEKIRMRSHEDIYADGNPVYTTLNQRDMDFSNMTDEELLKLKKQNFKDFMNKFYCATNGLIDNVCPPGFEVVKQAPSASLTIYKHFREWCLKEKIIMTKGKGHKNVYTQKEFIERLVYHSKKNFPDIEIKYGEANSVYGREENPRVFFKLKNKSSK
jgi:hypothetical protein